MADKKLSVCMQYDDMNNGPHERPFVPVGAPCLAYHLAFWHPDVVDATDNKRDSKGRMRHASDTNGGALEAAPRNNSKRVADYFDRVCANFIEKNPRFTPSPKSEPTCAEARTRAWMASFSIGDSEEVILVAECHTEYWRLSVILSFKEKDATVCRSAHGLFKSVVNHDVLSVPSFDVSGVRSAMVEEFETFVESNVLPALPEGDALCDLTERCFCNLIGQIFWMPETPGRWPDYDVNSHYVWDEPKIERFIKPRELVRRFWPLIEGVQGKRSAGPGDRDYEMAVSQLLSGRAVYASSLGHPMTPKASVTEKVPVVYSLVVCFDDAWQLGRLVDVVHSMEVLRLAAMRDIDAISNATNDLFEIRAALRKGVPLPKVQPAMDRLLRKDVSWRIERSQRYWRQFGNRVERLRIGKIEGFQTYEEFVHRRIGDTIAFIESTGRQLAYIRKEVDLRYQLLQTKSLESTGQRILSLQRAGELLLLLPLSYYLYMLLEKFLKKSGPDSFSLPGEYFSFFHRHLGWSHGAIGLLTIAIAMLLTFCVVFGLIKLAGHVQEKKMKETTNEE